MPNHRHLWVICCLGLLGLNFPAAALDPHVPLRHYGYQSWQTDDGLPQNTVHTVLQTRDGYLWFATEGGLVRFDGAQFTVYDRQNTPQLGGNTVYGLLEDRNRALWISTSDGLTRLWQGQFRKFSMADGLPSNAIWSVYESREGAIWALTTAGPARFAGGHFQGISVAQGLAATSILAEGRDGSLWLNAANGLLRIDPHDPSSVRKMDEDDSGMAMAADRQGHIWAATRTGVKVFSTSGAPVDFHLPAELGFEISRMLCTGDGHLWIATAKGVAEYDGKATRTYLVANHAGSDAEAARVTNLFEDREHAVWAATGRGLARLFAGQVSTFEHGDGPYGNQVLALYEDREGSLWLGMESAGLGILRDRKFTTYTTQDGMTDDLVRSVFQSGNGAIWVGTHGGGVNRYENGRFTALTTANGLSSNIALGLADGPLADVWVGTPNGLNQVRNGRIRVYTSADGLADDFVRSLYSDREGGLWIGTRRGLSHYANGSFTSYSAFDGLGNDLVGAMVQDADGSMWIGTLDGLTRFADGRFTNFTTQQGLSGNVITALYQDKGGALWIGTSGGSLSVRKDGKFFAFPVAQTQLPQNIYGILEDAEGMLWLSSDKGIFRVSRAQLQAVAAGSKAMLMPSIYGTADGMRIREGSSGGHPAAWKSQDGALWFATLRGLVTVDPAHMPVNRVPPLVAIEQVSLDDAPIDIKPGLYIGPDIGPGHTRFAIQYAGLSFVAPQKVRFRYKLEGIDRDWVDAGTRRVAYYTNIPPGRHVFRVAACNNDDVWSDADATFAFRLRPRFYQTYWFYLLLLLTLLLLAYEAYRWRVRSVESRFDAVLAERNRIAREIHDTLAQGFVAVSVQLEVVSRLLATSTDAARDQLEQARSMARGYLSEARSSIWNLRSQNAGQGDLASALTEAAMRITAPSGVKARVRVSGTNRWLDARLESELLRIGQEAITNVVRHAQAQQVDITLLFQEKKLRMTIKDDGRGFDGDLGAYAREGHFGLTGMRERTEQIGGRFSVNSGVGKGTEIQVEVSI